MREWRDLYLVDEAVVSMSSIKASKTRQTGAVAASNNCHMSEAVPSRHPSSSPSIVAESTKKKMNAFQPEQQPWHLIYSARRFRLVSK